MLNRFELEAVQAAFLFTPDEIRRLRAALAAEAILRVLLGRIDFAKALEVSETLFHLLFDANDSEFIALRRRISLVSSLGVSLAATSIQTAHFDQSVRQYPESAVPDYSWSWSH